ncbi:MAG: hypothetical protein JNL75_10830 [Chitinophagales bacterium]|nr:hypothetical protein [Chitinophagales bacterium]
MEINYSQLTKDMLEAAKGVLTTQWKEVKPFAEKEMKSFAENIKLIAKLKAEGKITEEQALLYLDIQKSTMRVVLLTIEGLGILAVENAINEAINAIKSTVNKAIGWEIL